MPCFGYEKKLIVVKGSGLFKKETRKKVYNTKEIRDNLEKYLKDNVDDIKERLVIIFIEELVEKLNITKTFEAVGGIVCEFDLQKPVMLERRLVAICNLYKVSAENGAISLLIETSGTSMQQLINEIRKLIEFARRRWDNQETRCQRTCNKNIRQ